MTKKLALIVLIGILVILATACGNKLNETQTDTIETKDSYKSVYSNSVFLGDSLLAGLADALDDSNIISNAGATALFSLKEVDKIANKKPESVYIMLGSDDLLWPSDNPIEDSMENYTKLIETIKDRLPNTKIHVLSVPPVTNEAITKEPRYDNIPNYNKSLENMALTEKVDYIDLSPIFDKYQNLYSKDGIHFTAEFYPILLDHINEHVDFSGNNEGVYDAR